MKTPTPRVSSRRIFFLKKAISKRNEKQTRVFLWLRLLRALKAFVHGKFNYIAEEGVEGFKSFSCFERPYSGSWSYDLLKIHKH